MSDPELVFNIDRLLAGADEAVAHKAGKIKLRTWSIDRKPRSLLKQGTNYASYTRIHTS